MKIRNAIVKTGAALSLGGISAGLALAAAVAIAPLTSAPALADDDPVGATEVWDIARGGQLYDNWMSVLDAESPEANHPLYPAAGKKSGATTWRCKECHGWDFMGKDGAYASGSHFTGIAGVRSLDGMQPAKIEAMIMAPEHGFTADMLPAGSVRKLAMFLSDGQIDADRFIDRATKQARGNPAKGARLFQTICAVCHGFEGREINFGSDDDPEFVGTVAAGNPWEALHKIWFGQPGVGMVALTALDIETLVDILAYTQTLPTK